MSTLATTMRTNPYYEVYSYYEIEDRYGLVGYSYGKNQKEAQDLFVTKFPQYAGNFLKFTKTKANELKNREPYLKNPKKRLRKKTLKHTIISSKDPRESKRLISQYGKTKELKRFARQIDLGYMGRPDARERLTRRELIGLNPVRKLSATNKKKLQTYVDKVYKLMSMTGEGMTFTEMGHAAMRMTKSVKDARLIQDNYMTLMEMMRAEGTRRGWRTTMRKY